jgi:predicted ATP-dependent endonuclease of OLD family/ribosomal protein L36
MKLIKAHIKKYKSIEDSTPVNIDKNVTVLVGINESGKSAFLESLYKADAVLDDADYDETYDYPRKDWMNYKRRSDKTKPSIVAELDFELDENEVNSIEEEFGKGVLTSRVFTETHHIDNSTTISVPIKESSYVNRLIKDATISEGLRSKLISKTTMHEVLDVLSNETLTGDDKTFSEQIKNQFVASNDSWKHLLVANNIWKKYLKPNIPQFLYFSDYNILPGKINIPTLQSVKSNKTADAGQKTALGLLDMANVTLEELQNPQSYEAIKAELEAVSLDISQKVFKYWRQNKQLLVEFDVKNDPNESAPYNSGMNLYIRVKNLQHGVSVPFDQRSKGFVWFFSFIVWFSSVKNRIGTEKDLILLLDEPGLSLHGLAQADFLHYIDDLSKDHQIIYTTHSPFMIDSNKLERVRTVEDVDGNGTIVSGNLSSTDKRTLFPLQAGLGYSLAQNLFIGNKNVLVEGPADLIYWKYFSSILESENREGLDPKIVIVPTGGLDKIATFVSLLTGNELEMVVVHDYEGSSDQRLDSLIKEKVIKDKFIMNYGQFRNPSNLKPSDVEDLFSESEYLGLFNRTYQTELTGKSISLKDLPKSDRIVRRIEKYLVINKIVLRKSGGFNHYLIASNLASNPLPKKSIDSGTLDRFESLFKSVNSLLK